MTEEKVIKQVFGSEWNELSEEQKGTAERIFDWMHNNFGLTGEEESIDRHIIAAIQLATLDVFGQSYEEIMTSCRKRELVDKRAMIYKIARDMSRSSTGNLAKMFPKNRSTSLYYGLKLADNLLEIDKDFKLNFGKLKTSTDRFYKLIYG